MGRTLLNKSRDLMEMIQRNPKRKLRRITWYLIGREAVLNKSRTAFCNEGEGPYDLLLVSDECVEVFKSLFPPLRGTFPCTDRPWPCKMSSFCSLLEWISEIIITIKFHSRE